MARPCNPVSSSLTNHMLGSSSQTTYSVKLPGERVRAGTRKTASPGGKWKFYYTDNQYIQVLYLRRSKECVERNIDERDLTGGKSCWESFEFRLQIANQ